MKILSTSPSTKKKQYIRHSRHENLSVIPYVRGRLIFAELVARAIATGQYDEVIVDLPSFLNGGHFGTILTGLFPSVSTLVIRNTKGRFISIPFAPNDAAACAIAAVQRMPASEQPVRLEFVDDIQVINYQEHLNHPEPTLPDDYSVHVDGLESWFVRPFHELDTIWKETPEQDKFYLDYRANQVAWRIATRLAKGKRTLLVCEYQLWHQVKSALEQDQPAKPSELILPWTSLSAALVLEDPNQFWALGLHDDYPAVVHRFHESMSNGQLDTFDKLDSLNTLITECMSNKEGLISCRKATKFQRYLATRLSVLRRYCPLPMSHLFDAAQACAGRHFEKCLATHCLNYPAAEPEDIYQYFSIHADSISTGEQPFFIPALMVRYSHYATVNNIPFGDTQEDRCRLISRLHPYLTRDEDKFLNSGRNSGPRWAIAPDYKLHEIVCDRVRVAADRQTRNRNNRAIRSWGSMGAGIHMKATISALTRGQNTIYIKQRASKNTKNTRLDDATPVVFLFEDNLYGHKSGVVHDSNITQRKSELGINQYDKHDPAPDCVYSLYSTINHESVICRGHLIRNELSSLVLLHTSHMGVQRYNIISQQPAQFQCRTEPNYDEELAIFSKNELGTAWAIKYANGYIIVMAKAGWQPSPALQAYASKKEVEIMVLPLTSLTPDILQRIRSMHFISTVMKRHRHCDRILERFIPEY